MNTSYRAAEETVAAFSASKAQLLKLLREQESRRGQEIRPRSRSFSAGSARFPTSSGQQRLWFIDQLETSSAAYHITLTLRLQGTLERSALERALDTLVSRHETLRTVFASSEGIPEQDVRARGVFQLQFVDLESLDEAVAAERLQQQKVDEAHEKFILEIGPLVRGRLVRMSSQDHVLMITLHHIISDGWSLAIFTRELSELYAAYRQTHANPLPALPVQYADYVHWQRKRLDTEPLQRQLDYWRAHLAGAPNELELPIDRPRSPEKSYLGKALELILESSLSGQLKALAQSNGLTLFMVLHAAWAILLSRLSGQEDVVIGTPVANRQRPEVEGMIGLFVNTLALRLDVRGDLSLHDFLQHVKQADLAALANQELPFEKVVEALQPQRTLSHNPLFQVMFVLQNTPPTELCMPGLDVTREAEVDSPTMFDLWLSLEDRGNEIAGSLNYSNDLFDTGTVQRWIACFKVLLRAMTDDPSQALADLPLLPDDERRKVIGLFNATRTDYPQDALVHELFEQQARLTPQAIAVIAEGRPITYTELNARANQLAHFLSAEPAAGEYIPILMPRSLPMLIAQLAVLKCGGIYVPIDPNHPVERQSFMLEDCGARRALIHDSAKPDRDNSSIQWIDYTAATVALERLATENLDLRPSPTPPAYVMYTSGSTGAPKGVLISHKGISRLVINNGYAELSATDCVAHCSNPAFDASTFEIWAALLTGARLVIVPHSVVINPDRFVHVLQQENVTVMFLTIGLFAEYAEVLSPIYPQLRYLLTGGDIVTPATVRRATRLHSPQHLLNAYGPTESTTFTTTFPIGRLDENARALPIGRPIANTQVYILDARREPVPIGVVGELYIGGDGLACGYLNRPDLTAERFVRNPFSQDPQARLYKTGDLGRWRPDGSIDFLGRNDQQVKIRGFRIELGEIETRLMQHSQVKEAVVLARQDSPGQKQLVAYVIPKEISAGHPTAVVEALRDFLQKGLPDHMLPIAWVILDRFPLTSNGKIDKRSLPAPALEAATDHPNDPPEGPTEQALAEIWRELLAIPQVSRHDNFFRLGGHSLKIVQMLGRLRQAGLSAEVRDIYVSSTLADLARRLTAHQPLQQDAPPTLIPAGSTSITPEMLPLVTLQPAHIDQIVATVPAGAANIKDIYPLAPSQEGILFHHLLDSQGGDIYARPMLLSLTTREKLEELIAALQAVIDRHDILRTAVLWKSLPQPVQVVYRDASLPVEHITLTAGADPLEELKSRMSPERQRLDLRRAPLIRLEVTPSPHSAEWYALVQTHHLVCDNESLQMLLSELYAHLGNQQHRLPEPVPYRHYVAQALRCSSGQSSEAFFRGKLADVHESTAPFGLTDIRGDGSQIEMVEQPLPATLAARIGTLARHLGVSTATLFHAAWGLVVARTSGRDDVVFGSVLLGRHQGSAGTQRILGMFINTLPLRLKLAGLTVRGLVEQTQRELVDLLGHEHASLALAQRCSGVAGSAPLFTALLNYRRGAPPSSLDWSDDRGVRLLASEGTTNYPIVLSIDDTGEQFVLQMEADRRIGPQRMLDYVCRALQQLLDASEDCSDKLVSSLSILPETERRQLIGLNPTPTSYPREQLIHELFEEQARRSPKVTAVVDEHCALTYEGLNRNANQLARFLIERGVYPDQHVAIYAERSVEMLVAILGVWKAGGAYVPLDPSHPRERLQYVLQDACPKVLLTPVHLKDSLPEIAGDTLLLDLASAHFARQEHTNIATPQRGQRSSNVAYVIYTSGSTGAPKGVLIEHRNVVNHWHALQALYNHSACHQRIALNAPFTFDASVQQLVQVLSGSTLFLIPPSVRLDARRLLSFLDEHRIEGIDCTPSQLRTWLSAGLLETPPQSLRTVLVGGEPIDPTLWAHLANSSAITFVNVYGPTECTVDSTAIAVRESASANIGRPMANSRLYILDPDGNLAPRGVAGEIHIGGAGVARGYLNRPDLTRERFTPDSFAPEDGARMYKTGDLGRWRADGVIEYLGRNDDQVKVRGFRIELGEIETQLMRHPRVKEAAVLARDTDTPGEKRLVAYVSTQTAGLEEDAFTVDLVRTYLKTVLPEYMVPSAVVLLEAFPMTPTGKLDRRALPEPTSQAYVSREYQAPQGELEEALARIWQTLLRVDRVSRVDHFFELGGDSLRGISLVERIAEETQVHLGVTAIFKHPTLQEMAAAVAALQAATPMESSPARIVSREETSGYRYAPLAFSQLQHWKQYRLGERPAVRQIAAATRLLGTLCLESLRKSIQLTIQHHDALRTNVIIRDGIAEQRIAPSSEDRLELLDLAGLPESLREPEARRAIDDLVLRPIQVATDPLFGIQLIKLAEQDHLLVMALEHMISDAYSVNILLEDLFSAYTQAVRGESCGLASVPIQFSDFAARQAASHRAWQERHGLFWTQHLAGLTDRQRLSAFAAASDGWGLAPVEISQQQKELWRHWCRQSGTTLVMSAFTVYAALVMRWCGWSEMVIQYQSDGRGDPKLQRTIGYLAAPLYLRIGLRQDDHFADLIARVTEELCRAHDHADASAMEAQSPRPGFTYNTAFNWVPSGRPLELPQLSGSPYELALRPFPFDPPTLRELSRDTEPVMMLYDGSLGVTGGVYFPLRAHSESNMKRFARSFRSFVEALLEQPGTRIKDLPLIRE